MNARLMACAFLIGCTATLALGQDKEHPQPPGIDTVIIGRPSDIDTDTAIDGSSVDNPDSKIDPARPLSRNQIAWLRKQSRDLLDIIKILYNGREAEIKELEAAQATMNSEVQIEHRIALIKATLSEKTAKP